MMYYSEQKAEYDKRIQAWKECAMEMFISNGYCATVEDAEQLWNDGHEKVMMSSKIRTF